MTIETFLINTNFVLLLFLTFFYWLNALQLMPISFFHMGQKGVLISQGFQVSFLVLRWVSSGHFPLSNLYESLLFLSWVLTVLLTCLNQIQWFTSQFFLSSFLGAIMVPIILLINTFTLFSLPVDLKVTTALVPALQSNWLIMHVTVMILSYGTLMAGCLFSISYLILTFLNLKEKVSDAPMIQTLYEPVDSIGLNESSLLVQNAVSAKPATLLGKFENLVILLDNISYRMIGLGFPLLTIGLLSGSIWANQTWGSYWSWDPKETWALITWFVFAIYLHMRLSKGWAGKKAAILATFGFFILWICYLGVNLMGKGLHSYGFIN